MFDRPYQKVITPIIVVAVYLVGFALAMLFFEDALDLFYMSLTLIALFMFITITLAMMGAIGYNIYQYTTSRQQAPADLPSEG